MDSKKTTLIVLVWFSLVARVEGQNWGELGEGDQMVQASSYNINKYWGCNVQHGNCS